MKKGTNLIVMLTHNDRTVPNAAAVFEACRTSAAEIWGMKEEGLPLPQMKALFSEMKKQGKTTALEVVAYTEYECMAGAEMAALCGCDYLMGTVFSDAVNAFCKEKKLKYLPFVGQIEGRPSVLRGTVEEMLAEARHYLEKGVYGIDLLGYRYTEDAPALITRFVQELQAPVCVAGSVNSFERLNELKAAAPWAFTIGGGFFEEKFGEGLAEQIDCVCAYMKEC